VILDFVADAAPWAALALMTVVSVIAWRHPAHGPDTKERPPVGD
jgi:hypothetical protein